MTIGIILILAAIVIVAISPSDQLYQACLKDPGHGDCPQRIRDHKSRASSSTMNCVKYSGKGCCVKAHDSDDGELVCDEYIPLPSNN